MELPDFSSISLNFQVFILQLWLTLMKDVVYEIHVNCIEDTQCKLNTVVPVLKRPLVLTLEVSYPTVTMINMINGKMLTLA